MATRSLRYFAENIAPIPEAVKYLGIVFNIKFRILSNEEELAIGDEIAAVVPDNKGRQELVSRLARALVEAQGVPVVFSPDPVVDLQERLKWALLEWDDVFTVEMAAAYDRARINIVHAVQEIADDPFPVAGRNAPSGESTVPSGVSRDDSLPPENGPMSSTTLSRMKRRKRSSDLPNVAS